MTNKGRGLLGAAGIGLNKLTTGTAGVPPSTTGALPEKDTTDTTDHLGPTPQMRSRNASKPILSGEVKMQTVYVTREDQDRATDASAYLKKLRVVRGQIGFSLVVRIGLRLLEKQLREEERIVIDIARELSRAD